jgi:hypothetical protein
LPATEKPAVVANAFKLPKATVPEPLTWLQDTAMAAGGFGFPSSLTAPARLAEAGQTMV